MRLRGLLWAWVVVVGASAQQGKWAGANDPTAKALIDMERQWSEEACTHNLVQQTILADDFEGTSPAGKLYSKSDALRDAKASKTVARECHLNDARVRFFGDNLAVVYGNESGIEKESDGKEHPRSLVWTDTWLKRNGIWQIIAVQDMPAGGK